MEGGRWWAESSPRVRLVAGCSLLLVPGPLLVIARALHPCWPQEIMDGQTDDISCSGRNNWTEATLTHWLMLCATFSVVSTLPALLLLAGALEWWYCPSFTQEYITQLPDSLSVLCVWPAGPLPSRYLPLHTSVCTSGGNAPFPEPAHVLWPAELVETHAERSLSHLS